MKILRQEGVRYGWRGVAIFPEDFFDDVGVPVGPRYLHLYQGRRVFAVIGTPGLVLMSSVNGKLKPHEDGEPRILMRSDGRAEIEALAPPTTPIQWGETATGGAGNWPTSANRALMRFIETTEQLTLTQFNIWLDSDNVSSGDRFKGLIYMADGAGGYPRTRIGVSDPTGPSTGIGAELLTAPCAIVVPAGGPGYWEGYVCDGGSGSGGYTDSGGALTNVAIMLNGGEVEYASPPAIAGLWPGGPGPYSNVPSIWFDGTY